MSKLKGALVPGTLFRSGDAKAVQRVLKSTFPNLLISSDDLRLEDTLQKVVHVVVTGQVEVSGYRTVDPDEVQSLAQELYLRSAPVSSRPVHVDVWGLGWTVGSYSPDYALVDASLGFGQQSSTPGRDNRSAQAPEPTFLMSAEIQFWTDESASVRLRRAEGMSDHDVVAFACMLVPFYFAKIMYNLADHEAATQLLDDMVWIMRMLATEVARDGAEDGVSVHVLPEGLSLVESQIGEPVSRYLVELVRAGSGSDVRYGTALGYEPETAEGYYAPLSLVLLTEAVVSPVMPWWVPACISLALRQMMDSYETGPSAWNSLAALERVPLEAARYAFKRVNLPWPPRWVPYGNE